MISRLGTCSTCSATFIAQTSVWGNAQHTLIYIVDAPRVARAAVLTGNNTPVDKLRYLLEPGTPQGNDNPNLPG
ncbi:hypothetical protein N7495_006573 [Penicillium taxi]|uniref:uncharacterized protein n=1 Tax=Penicillium taxi TaxID=168475 RepID=UPI0025456EA9|nr:uncharacterized protein N7495_006573 [Penicillium taxi]KAJ5894882.1 hypothetical protein N7495_006573 [Penicillium taxi]